MTRPDSAANEPKKIAKVTRTPKVGHEGLFARKRVFDPETVA